jgi:hypothetical protein
MSIVFSCDNFSSKKELKSNQNSNQANHTKTKNTIAGLSPDAKKMVSNWKEYQNMNEYIQQYREISISNSLLNAKQLSELAQQLKDSVRIEKLNIPSVKIRLNVLYNETLRLADMATINQITEIEVIRENKNILNAYSALNIKINNMIDQEKLNIEVNNFLSEINTKTKINIRTDSSRMKINEIIIDTNNIKIK